MNKSGIDVLVERWSTDGAFRDAFAKQPTKVAAVHGIELSAHEWQAVAALGLTASTVLETRLNTEHPCDPFWLCISVSYC